eukprot:TRINITY_DN24503_c0_g1_i1.p1 TRINITY_DN24503_c0_g1~~TRINITY_DN24503_c0_g1_i1.p1  ORF type:complete len:238 (+),score=38.35 TRINITY_DN24503_c0_g1_i1:2-715(+)
MAVRVVSWHTCACVGIVVFLVQSMDPAAAFWGGSSSEEETPPSPEDSFDEDGIDRSHVTCLSTVKLRHRGQGYRLHSHQVSYGSGSKQQSVTGFPEADDSNSYWIIRAAHGKSCDRGALIKCQSQIRLTHVNTGKNIHTHKFSSPLTTSYQEISAFGEDGEGDEGDNWVVECVGKEKAWRRGAGVRLRHIGTGVYLHMTGKKYNHPIPGQFEVCGVSRPQSDNIWETAEGVFFARTR